jgi:hypothetical protein
MNGPKQTFANLKLSLGRKRQHPKLLGHSRGAKAQLDKRLSVLEFRWIRVARIQPQPLHSSFGLLRRAQFSIDPMHAAQLEIRKQS